MMSKRCPKFGIYNASKKRNFLKVELWEFTGQSQAPFSLKEMFQVQALYGFIIASHNLFKSSKGLTLPTVSLVYCYCPIDQLARLHHAP